MLTYWPMLFSVLLSKDVITILLLLDTRSLLVGESVKEDIFLPYYGSFLAFIFVGGLSLPLPLLSHR